MKQRLSLEDIMLELDHRWSTAPDVRKQNNNMKYTISDGILAAFAVFFMQSSSFLAHQRLLESKKGRSNARSLFQIEEIPSDQQIRNLLDRLPSSYFQDDYWNLLEALKEEQHLLSFLNDLKTYSIALDGVNFFSSEKISCPKCLKREDRTGTTHYYHSAITPVFVKPGQAQVLPLPPEFIVPQDGSEKQDCERTAAKRWLSQHSGYFKDYSVSYLGDDLYANQIPLRNGDDALLVNWHELVITHEETDKILYRNSFITNHSVTESSVILLSQIGRTRWKIENENNNTLKTKGYHFEHNFGHGQQDLSNVLATPNNVNSG
jgi:hypothetical protein